MRMFGHLSQSTRSVEFVLPNYRCGTCHGITDPYKTIPLDRLYVSMVTNKQSKLHFFGKYTS